MVKKYSNRHEIEEFSVRDYVGLKIPREGRTCSGNLRLTCQVIAVPRSDCYRLRCQYGLLAGLHTLVLTRIPTPQADRNILLDSAPEAGEITLAQAARQESTGNKVNISCNRRTGPQGCATKRCRCFKKDLAAQTTAI